MSDHSASVNGAAYSGDALRAAKSAAHVPLELGIESDGWARTIRVVYDGTLCYPRLERIEGAGEGLLRSLGPL